MFKDYPGNISSHNSLEKQNVRRAIDIFSTEIIGAIRSQHEQGVPGFEEIDETVNFMELVGKWWRIMDVSSTTQGAHKRLLDKLAFYSSEDDRLSWLKNFLLFLEDWKRQSNDRQFLSRDLRSNSAYYKMHNSYNKVLTRCEEVRFCLDEAIPERQGRKLLQQHETAKR